MTDGSQVDEREADLIGALLRAQDTAARQRYATAVAESKLDAARQRINQLEASTAFGLGAALVGAARSFRGLVGLPASLYRVGRQLWQRSDSTCLMPAHPASDGLGEVKRASPDALLTAAYFSRRRPAAQALNDLRLAVVMDEFTLACFRPECELLELRNEGYEDQLTDFMPHLLLVESAWRGSGGTWRDRIHPASADLRYLIDCCNRRGIPTVFWNKEDPAHFDHFLEAAGLFDHVFTTDADCIDRYRQALGHDRVHLLMFGCQPRLHHPIERFERCHAISFAGSWYYQYPDRCRDFDAVMDGIGELLPVDIYDRNADRGDPKFEFPQRYRPMLRGSLAYDQIEHAYKGYAFSININTITDSTSMFARRVYELMASNTLVVSNPSKALSAAFGDLVVSGDAATIAIGMKSLVSDPNAQHRLRLRALRAVMYSHTCAQRLATLAGAVLQQPMAAPRITVTVLAQAKDVDQALALIGAFRGQQWPAKRLLLLATSEVASRLPKDGDADVSVVDADRAARMFPIYEWAGQWLAPWHADDHYGRHYLTDLALASGWIDTPAIGKGRRYCWTGAMPRLAEGETYAEDQPLWLRSSLLRADALGNCSLAEWLERMYLQIAPDLAGLAVDEFNYCASGRDHPMATVDVD